MKLTKLAILFLLLLLAGQSFLSYVYEPWRINQINSELADNVVIRLQLMDEFEQIIQERKLALLQEDVRKIALEKLISVYELSVDFENTYYELPLEYRLEIQGETEVKPKGYAEQKLAEFKEELKDL